GPAQPRRAADHGAASLDGDLSAQPVQFPYVLESVLEDRLRHHAASPGLGHEADVGSLQVGREAGVGPGRDVYGPKLTRSADGEAVSLLHDISAGGPQLEAERLQVCRLEVFQQDLTASGGRRDRVGP